MDTTTDFASDIVDMISCGENPYGHTGKLEPRDVLAIINSMHTHLCGVDPNDTKMLSMLEGFMREIESAFADTLD